VSAQVCYQRPDEYGLKYGLAAHGRDMKWARIIHKLTAVAVANAKAKGALPRRRRAVPARHLDRHKELDPTL